MKAWRLAELLAGAGPMAEVVCGLDERAAVLAVYEDDKEGEPCPVVLVCEREFKALVEDELAIDGGTDAGEDPLPPGPAAGCGPRWDGLAVLARELGRRRNVVNALWEEEQ